MHHDGSKAYRGPKIPVGMSKGSASKETELPERQKILLQIPVPAMWRPKRMVRSPARMQDYQLDKFFNVLPLANIISFPEGYRAFTFVHLDVSMRDASFGGGSGVAKLGFRS